MPKRSKADPKATAVQSTVSTATIVTPTSTEIIVSEDSSVQTKEQLERKSNPVQEKVRNAEKDTAPVVIVSWHDSTGKRHTRTYTCAKVDISADTNEHITDGGKKTTVNIVIEAQVCEVDNR